MRGFIFSIDVFLYGFGFLSISESEAGKCNVFINMGSDGSAGTPYSESYDILFQDIIDKIVKLGIEDEDSEDAPAVLTKLAYEDDNEEKAWVKDLSAATFFEAIETIREDLPLLDTFMEAFGDYA